MASRLLQKVPATPDRRAKVGVRCEVRWPVLSRQPAWVVMSAEHQLSPHELRLLRKWEQAGKYIEMKGMGGGDVGNGLKTTAAIPPRACQNLPACTIQTLQVMVFH